MAATSAGSSEGGAAARERLLNDGSADRPRGFAAVPSGAAAIASTEWIHRRLIVLFDGVGIDETHASNRWPAFLVASSGLLNTGGGISRLFRRRRLEKQEPLRSIDRSVVEMGFRRIAILRGARITFQKLRLRRSVGASRFVGAAPGLSG